MLKLDSCNVFNTIRRDRMLESVDDLAPVVYPMVHSAYSAPSLVPRCFNLEEGEEEHLEHIVVRMRLIFVNSQKMGYPGNLCVMVK